MASPAATNADKPLSREDVRRLTELRLMPNLVKIPLFISIMVWLNWVAWTTDVTLVKWAAYVGIGYMWMAMVTFMHDAGHFTLFRSRLANWIFGIVCMMPLMATFVGFKEDHLEHHRYNRSPDDPDAFTMGKRGILDFMLFYAYVVAGILLSFLHFNLLYPITRFGPKEWAIHIFETVVKIGCYWALIAWAIDNGVLAKTLELWLIPVYIFTLFNSVRFIAEHYGTPWNEGQLVGSRTTISNPVNRFFWNNINWHIGHHVYPAVPWYNLVELHRLMEPTIKARGAIVDKSYTGVFLKALVGGPETEDRLAAALWKRGRTTEAPAAQAT
jgi:fatty acid desaturase